MLKIPALIFIGIFMMSCNRPACNNTNPLFDIHSPHSEEYKAELAAKLANTDRQKLRYWLHTYYESGNKRYLLTHIQGDGLCAEIELSIHQSYHGIEDIIKHKGKGYSGAELRQVQYTLKQDSNGAEFVFQQIGGILD